MKPLFILLCILCCAIASAQQADILIKNGKILDGTGNSWYYADIAIKDGKILKIGRLENYTAPKIIDASGLLVAPGFIDVHTHIEGDEMQNPTADNFILDGVTTVVTGNCGSSAPDLHRYFRQLDSVKLSVNVASLLGHNTVRRTIMGTANRNPTNEEMQRMEELVRQSMKAGAVGLSTGLQYIPGAYSNTNEIVSLARVAAQYNGVYASHMRDEGDQIVASINETLTIGREASIPVQISHFKLSGQQNWGRSMEALDMIRRAREQGIEVTIDQYPYTASSTSLSIMMPDEILADGNDSIRARLQRPEIRKYVVDYLLQRLKKRKLKHFSYAMVAYYRADTSYNGKSIEEINRLMGRKHKAKEEAHTIVDMMLKGGAAMVFHGMSDKDVKQIMQYPFNMFASDASIRIYGQGAPHPRGYGTNSRVLSRYVRDQHVISLEEAIRRMTSLPAQKFRLADRGLLKEGFAADIVIFQENEVEDLSTFEKPHAYSKGFRFVIVNGQVVAENDRHLGVRSGRVLHGPGYGL